MITYAIYTSFFTTAFIAISALLLMKIVNGIIDDKGHIQKDWKYYIITGIVVFCIFFFAAEFAYEKMLLWTGFKTNTIATCYKKGIEGEDGFNEYGQRFFNDEIFTETDRDTIMQSIQTLDLQAGEIGIRNKMQYDKGNTPLGVALDINRAFHFIPLLLPLLSYFLALAICYLTKKVINTNFRKEIAEIKELEGKEKELKKEIKIKEYNRNELENKEKELEKRITEIEKSDLYKRQLKKLDDIERLMNEMKFETRQKEIEKHAIESTIREYYKEVDELERRIRELKNKKDEELNLIKGQREKIMNNEKEISRLKEILDKAKEKEQIEETKQKNVNEILSRYE